jgi:ABC-type lipoprotein export system ATPase subunit/ABC-type antimicrobial peptide transport system permease subunit
MIRLKNLHKYFNRGKINEIHVINDTTIEFPEKGLVAMTGPSGCGKTTLLNVIGGLDKFSSGLIDFDGHELSSYDPSKWDPIRNKYVGYIFQNYNLITDKTVYENVEIALNMAGLYKAEEIEERVNYVLRSVGMYNFRRRNVLALSGGQQQRVAIARAIAKNPKVVLADEPTGNLDANNTFEVMGLIKKISQTCLVILVSHEKDLVDFYADRVLELSDGKIINDYINEGNRTLEHIDDRNIYLQDLEKESITQPLGIEYYYLKHPVASPNLKVIYTNNTFYIKAESKAKIIFLNEDSEIRLIDEHYRKPETEDISQSEFDLSQFGVIKSDPSRKSFIRFWDTFKAGFKKVLSGRKFFGKLFLVVYFIISALIVYNLASFGNLTNADEKKFFTIGRNLISVEMQSDTTYNDIMDIVNNTSVSDVVPYFGPQYISLYVEKYYQASGYRKGYGNISAFPMKVSQINAADLVSGSLPTKSSEVAIDQWLAERLFEQKSIADLGIISADEFIGAEISIYGSPTVKIVGIVETRSPIIVLSDDNYLMLIQSGFMSLGTALGHYEITSGVNITATGQVLVSKYSGLSIGSTMVLYGVSMQIVGQYESEFINQPIISNPDAVKIIIEQRLLNYTEQKGSLYFYAEDVNLAISDISAMEFNAVDAYEFTRENYLADQRERISGRIMSIFVTIAGIIVYIFLMMRSSMLGRIKEIGIYRSIGATKKDIYKIFISEIIAFTTIGSLTGYLFMTYVVNQIEKSFGGLVSTFNFPFTLFFGGILGIYLINIIFGMLPIFSLLRKTPSEINAKYDI